jgi:hypothetical protein
LRGDVRKEKLDLNDKEAAEGLKKNSCADFICLLISVWPEGM